MGYYLDTSMQLLSLQQSPTSYPICQTYAEMLDILLFNAYTVAKSITDVKHITNVNVWNVLTKLPDREDE